MQRSVTVCAQLLPIATRRARLYLFAARFLRTKIVNRICTRVPAKAGR
jgi:hypothetical protein